MQRSLFVQNVLITGYFAKFMVIYSQLVEKFVKNISKNA